MTENCREGMLSVIVPCYNEEAVIGETITAILAALKDTGIPFELLFVSDGSTDKTVETVRQASQRDPEHIKGIALCRNFGKEGAILAGLRYAKGRCAVIIDSDLQQPPECIPPMYRLWQSGFDIVEGIKAKRQTENPIKRMFASLFYQLMSLAMGIDLENASDFKLLDRRVVDVLLSLPERETFFRGLTFWSGFPMTNYTYTVRPRRAGQTKWSFVKLVKYAVRNIISFSSIPLSLITVLGFIMLVLAFLFGLRALRIYISGEAAGGITTVVGLLLLIGGLILLSLSIIGRYIASIYNEIKGRPRYLVSDVFGADMALLKIDVAGSFQPQGGNTDVWGPAR